jgi:hypothetical protein
LKTTKSHEKSNCFFRTLCPFVFQQRRTFHLIFPPTALLAGGLLTAMPMMRVGMGIMELLMELFWQVIEMGLVMLRIILTESIIILKLAIQVR